MGLPKPSSPPSLALGKLSLIGDLRGIPALLTNPQPTAEWQRAGTFPVPGTAALVSPDTLVKTRGTARADVKSHHGFHLHKHSQQRGLTLKYPWGRGWNGACHGCKLCHCHPCASPGTSAKPCCTGRFSSKTRPPWCCHTAITNPHGQQGKESPKEQAWVNKESFERSAATASAAPESTTCCMENSQSKRAPREPPGSNSTGLSKCSSHVLTGNHSQPEPGHRATGRRSLVHTCTFTRVQRPWGSNRGGFTFFFPLEVFWTSFTSQMQD